MKTLSNRALSSMNYLFLQNVFHNNYPESVKNEISYFLDSFARAIQRSNSEDIENIDMLYDYTYQEFNEGFYYTDMITAVCQLEDYLENYTDLDEKQIDSLLNFYNTVIEDLEKLNELE